MRLAPLATIEPTDLAAAMRGPDSFSASARELGMEAISRETVRRGVAALESAGLIIVERIPGRKSKFTMITDNITAKGGSNDEP